MICSDGLFKRFSPQVCVCESESWAHKHSSSTGRLWTRPGNVDHLPLLCMTVHVGSSVGTASGSWKSVAWHRMLLCCTLLSLMVGGSDSFKTLDYLYSIGGKQTVSGQHNREPNSEPDKWTQWIKDTTGKYPGLWSGDMLFEASDIAARPTMVQEAQKQWEAGSLVHIMWHACNPVNGPPCEWEGGVLTTLTDEQWAQLTTDGAELNLRWKSMLDDVAQYLSQLKDGGVEVLFRPLHEQNQGLFWWAGRPGAHGSKKLYQITHDYMTHVKRLTNLVWIWDIQDFGTLPTDLIKYDPGSKYYDIAALDVYEGYATWKYDNMTAFAGKKLIAVGECAVLPDISRLVAEPRWSFFMAWAELVEQSNSIQKIQGLYSAQNVITREEMPGWKHAWHG